jgi:hypothetical protein
MTNVVVLADQAGVSSNDVLAGAAGIGKEAETLRTEVDRFLLAVHTDSGERRQFERIAGEALTAMLRLPEQKVIQAPVNDVSRGGISLLCDLHIAAGTEVSVELTNAGGAMIGKVVRTENGVLAIEFLDDDATHARMERTIQTMTATRRAA